MTAYPAESERLRGIFPGRILPISGVVLLVTPDRGLDVPDNVKPLVLVLEVSDIGSGPTDPCTTGL